MQKILWWHYAILIPTMIFESTDNYLRFGKEIHFHFHFLKLFRIFFSFFIQIFAFDSVDLVPPSDSEFLSPSKLKPTRRCPNTCCPHRFSKGRKICHKDIEFLYRIAKLSPRHQQMLLLPAPAWAVVWTRLGAQPFQVKTATHADASRGQSLLVS